MRVKRDGLSPHQWGALLWLVTLAPAAELFPAVGLAAGRGAWLTPLAAVLVMLPLLRLTGEVPQNRGVALLCGLWMELLLVLRLTLCARRLLWSGERDGAVWFFILTLTALALWMGGGKLSALGRAGQIYLVILLGAAALVLGLSLTRVRADRILPLWTENIGPVLLSGLRGAGSLCWGLLPMLFLPPQRSSGKSRLLWSGGGCVLLTLAQFILMGNLGVGLCARSESAFFALTKSVGVEGGFQRVESVVAALWTISDLMLTVILARAVGICGETVCPKVKYESGASLALLGGAGIALWSTRWGAAVANWNREWVWMGNLTACLLVIFGVFLVKRTKSP